MTDSNRGMNSYELSVVDIATRIYTTVIPLVYANRDGRLDGETVTEAVQESVNEAFAIVDGVLAKTRATPKT